MTKLKGTKTMWLNRAPYLCATCGQMNVYRAGTCEKCGQRFRWRTYTQKLARKNWQTNREFLRRPILSEDIDRRTIEGKLQQQKEQILSEIAQEKKTKRYKHSRAFREKIKNRVKIELPKVVVNSEAKAPKTQKNSLQLLIKKLVRAEIEQYFEEML